MHALKLYRRHEYPQGTLSPFPQIQREYTETCRQLSFEIGVHWLKWIGGFNPGSLQTTSGLKDHCALSGTKSRYWAQGSQQFLKQVPECWAREDDLPLLGTQDGCPGCIPNSCLNFPSADTLPRPLQLTCITSLIPTISTYFPCKST